MDLSIFVENVKKYCKAKGVTPTAACREAGLVPNFLTVIEHKGQIPSIERCIALSEYLGCTVNDLIGQTKDPLHEWWDSLTEDQQHAIFVLTGKEI